MLRLPCVRVGAEVKLPIAHKIHDANRSGLTLCRDVANRPESACCGPSVPSPCIERQLHRYRRFKKTALEKRTERIEALAHQLALPRAALDGGASPVDLPDDLVAAPIQSFVDPDPFQEFTFPTRIAAKLAIADYLGMPLAKLPQHQLDEIDTLLSRTLQKQNVFAHVRTQIQPTLRR